MDTLFLGLTRPTMIAGVTYTFFVINAMITVILFIASSNLLILFIAIPVHMVGYYICLQDHRSFDILFVKFKKCMQCRNRGYYGANSYDPY